MNLRGIVWAPSPVALHAVQRLGQEEVSQPVWIPIEMECPFVSYHDVSWRTPMVNPQGSLGANAGVKVAELATSAPAGDAIVSAFVGTIGYRMVADGAITDFVSPPVSVTAAVAPADISPSIFNLPKGGRQQLEASTQIGSSHPTGRLAFHLIPRMTRTPSCRKGS